MKLFEVIERADRIVCNEYEMDEIGYPSTDIVHMECGDVTEEFEDQDIVLDKDGQAQAEDIYGDVCNLTFYKEIPLQASDIT